MDYGYVEQRYNYLQNMGMIPSKEDNRLGRINLLEKARKEILESNSN